MYHSGSYFVIWLRLLLFVQSSLYVILRCPYTRYAWLSRIVKLSQYRATVVFIILLYCRDCRWKLLQYRTTLGNWAFPVAAAGAWNALPSSVRSAPDMELGHILWPSDPGIQRPGYPVDPVTLFYGPNELQMSTCVKYSQAKEFLIITGKSKSSLHGRTSRDFSPTTDTWQWLVISPFQMYVLHFGHFFENRKNSGFTLGQNDDPVTRTWKMTRWPNDPVPYLFCAVAAAVPPRPQDGTDSVIVLFTIVSSCVTDCIFY